VSERIDVSIEHKHPPPQDGGRPHPNTCPKCGSHYRDDELEQHLNVCPQCGHHFPVHARERIRQLVDEDSFGEEAAELRSDDPLDFFDLRPYTERLAEAELATGLGEAIVIGRAAIEEQPCQLAVMEFAFMGGSMGRIVGEKFARACDGAAERGVPLVSVTTTGGARMQEGILSLMQLPKTVCAVEDLHDTGGTLISVMAHPTTGRRARQLRQPRRRARGRARARSARSPVRAVVQQTTREKLPEDFGLGRVQPSATAT
jgi:acetyl-CoA carboxylase carboxyl transferase subunit beta